ASISTSEPTALPSRSAASITSGWAEQIDVMPPPWPSLNRAGRFFSRPVLLMLTLLVRQEIFRSPPWSKCPPSGLSRSLPERPPHLLSVRHAQGPCCATSKLQKPHQNCRQHRWG